MIEIQNLPQFKRQVRDVVKDIEYAQKQTRFATAVALTRTAFQIVQEEKATLPRHLDRPTPFTSRAFRYERATKDRLRASVYVAPIQEQYLKYQVLGGTRTSGIVIPVEQTVNRYGNIPGLRGGRVIHRLAGRPDIFVGQPKWGASYGPAGVWQRMGQGMGRYLRLLMAFEQEAKYKDDRFPFFRIARAAFEKHYEAQFDAAIAYAFRGLK